MYIFTEVVTGFRANAIAAGVLVAELMCGCIQVTELRWQSGQADTPSERASECVEFLKIFQRFRNSKNPQNASHAQGNTPIKV